MLGFDVFGSFFWIRVKQIVIVSNMVMVNLICLFDLMGIKNINSCKNDII